MTIFCKPRSAAPRKLPSATSGTNGKPASNAIAAHAKAARDNKPKGTVEWLRQQGTGGMLRCLKVNGHRLVEIDCMTREDAKKKVQNYMIAYTARRAKAEAEARQTESEAA